MAKTSLLASQVVEIVDESSNVVLIFEDSETLADYDRSQLTGEPFDYDRIRQQALGLRAKLDDFLTDLQTLEPRATPNIAAARPRRR